MTDTAKLCIIEANDNLRITMAEDFEEQGFEVYAVKNANEALQLIKEQQPLGVICCVEAIETLDIWDFLDAVLAHYQNPPAIILTTNSSQFSLDVAFARGVEAVFVKPFDRITLEELTKSAVIPRMNHFVLRKVTRIEKQLPCDIMYGDKTIHATTENISQGGLLVLIKGAEPPTIQATVDFVLHLESGEKLKGKALAVWVKLINPYVQRYGIGLKFIPEEMDVSAINAYVNKQKTAKIFDIS